MNVPYQRILLATEGSEFDAGAERVGIALAADCGAPLLAVMPLVSNPVYESLAPEREERDEAAAAAHIAALGQAAQAQGVALHGNVRLGEAPFREIVDEAAERQAELIVLRRRGRRSYLANLLLGEMVHTVTGHAPCDVLIVPRAARLWSRGIVLATDGSSHSARATQLAAAFAARRDLPLAIVSVAETASGQAADPEAKAAAAEIVRTAVEQARTLGARADGHVAAGKPADEILKVAEDTGADLIVIGRRGLNRLERILVGSTSESVAGRFGAAVLIVRQTAPAR